MPKSAANSANQGTEYVPQEDQVFCNLEVERAVLGAILVDEWAMERVVPILPDQRYFYGRAHRTLYRAFLRLREERRHIDLTMVTSSLHAYSELELIGGSRYLAELAEGVVSTAVVDEYAMILRRWHTRRELDAVGTWLREQANTTNGDLESQLGAGLQRFQEVMAGHLDPRGIDTLESLSDIAKRLLQESEAGTISTVMSNLGELDRHLGGFHVNSPGEGRLIVWAGRPAMGKSLSALDIAARIAEHHPVLVFSYEMSKGQLGARLIVRECKGRLEFDHARRPAAFGPEVVEIFNRTVRDASRLNLHIEEANGQGIDYVVQKTKLTQSKFGHLGLVVIDYLQLIEPARGQTDNIAHLKECTRKLKTLAAQTGCDILCLSQLNRGVESRTNKRPLLSDLRESGTIEQDSDIVVMCYRDDYYSEEGTKNKELELIVAKNRNGPVGTAHLLIETQQFRLYSKPESAYSPKSGFQSEQQQ